MANEKPAVAGTCDGLTGKDLERRTSPGSGGVPEKVLEVDNPGWDGPDVCVSSNLPNSIWSESGKFKH